MLKQSDPVVEERRAVKTIAACQGVAFSILNLAANGDTHE